MTIGMTVDAEALPHEHAAATTTTTTLASSGVPGGDIQAYVTPAQTQPSLVINRDGYSTATLVDLAGTAGITNYSTAVFTNNPDCAVQWPYAVGVPMTYGFGMRDGRLHEGTDFIPGAGAHIRGRRHSQRRPIHRPHRRHRPLVRRPPALRSAPQRHQCHRPTALVADLRRMLTARKP